MRISFFRPSYLFIISFLQLGLVNSILAQEETQSFAEFTWSNDFWYFPDPSDKHYTNGMYLDISVEDIIIKPIDFTLIKASDAHVSSFGFAVTQNIYTPENKESTDLILSDRPFASYLTGHFYKLSLNRETGKRIRSEWQFGVLGRIAGGGATQNFIHSIIPTSEEVPGWINEVRSDVIINYNVLTESSLFRSRFIESWVSLDFRLGSLFTDLTGGINFQAGFFDSRFDNLRGWKTGRKLKASFVGGARLRMVAHDATITGGLFRKDSRFRDVYDQNNTQILLEMGTLITYGKAGFKFSLFQTSPDIKGGDSHSWGSASFQYQF